jgi:hypothetical protein
LDDEILLKSVAHHLEAHRYILQSETNEKIVLSPHNRVETETTEAKYRDDFARKQYTINLQERTVSAVEELEGEGLPANVQECIDKLGTSMGIYLKEFFGSNCAFTGKRRG